uniref:Ig-like domain-containing protein n=1 Tax=Romanomermis culicivorax TaxID=13658 RepID=A0A915J6G6_ROMCU
MTGDCGNRSHPGYKAFERIASTSSGQIFHLEKRADVSEVLNYVRVIVQNRKVSLISLDREISGAHVIHIPIDSHLYEFTVSLSGDEPEINLIDPQGQHVSETNGLRTVLNLGNVLVYNVKTPKPGMWTLRTFSKGKHTVRINGIDDKSHEFQRISLTAITGQIAAGPKAFMASKYTGFRDSLLNLTCQVESIVPFTLYWFKGSVQIAGPLFYRSSDSAVWQLANLDPRDNGYYKCMVISSSGNFSVETYVETKEPSPKLIAPKNVTAIFGANAYLHCRAQPSRMMHNGTLRIEKVALDNEGPYVCHVITAGGDATAEVYLSILEPPEVLVEPKSFYFPDRGAFNISCMASGEPKPDVKWYFQSKLIDTSYKHYITYKNELLVRDATRENAGRYECRATSAAGTSSDFSAAQLATLGLEEKGSYVCRAMNRFGSQEVSRQLVITGLAVLAEIQPEEQVIAGRPLRINCAVLVGNPKPILKWFKDDKPLVIGSTVQIENDGSSLIIQSAMPGDEGRYTCQAVNPAGNATISVRASIITPPVFEPAPLILRELIVKEGQTLNLPCNAVAKPKPYVSWTRDRRPLTTSAEYAIQPNGNLFIQQTSVQDSGVYVCKALNLAGEISLEYNVSVQAPPKLVHDQAHHTVVHGKSISIKCQANGMPMPTVRWFLENGITPVPPPFTIVGDGSLFLHRATEKQSGLYICRAENVVGKDERMVRLSVHTRPVVAGSGEKRLLTTRINETVTLSCPAISADPKPSWKWMYENRLVNYSLLQNIRFLGDDALQISRVSAEHSGTYSCTVSNIVGNDTVLFHLKVEEPPKINNNAAEMVTLVKGMKLLLQCQSSGIPPPTISWRRNGLEIIPNGVETIQNDGSLLIHEVNMLHSGSYKCTAKNTAGYDVKEILSAEPPTILPSTKNVYSVVQGQKTSLKCLVKGTPKPMIMWYRKLLPIVTKVEDNIRLSGDELLIDGVKGNHQGLFTCKAINDAGVVTHDILVNVTVPPLIKDPDIVVSESVTLGSPITLYCPIYSTPTPMVKWYLENRLLTAADSRIHFSSDDRRIIIPASTALDGGTYRCVASNSAGEASKNFRIDIAVAPTLDESKLHKRIEVLLNRSAVIKCPIYGNPNPDINWLLNGRFLKSGSLRTGIRISNDKKELIIEQAEIQDEGTYTCVASNTAGTLEVDSSLILL